MAQQKQKAQYAPPATQVDLEERLANGNESSAVLSTADNYKQAVEEDENAREYTVEGNNTDDYVNVDPIYQTYANETEAPARAEEGPEADLEAVIHGEAVVTNEGVVTNEEHEQMKADKASAREAEADGDTDTSDVEAAGHGDQTGPDTPNA